MNKLGIEQSPVILSEGLNGVEMGLSVKNAARLQSYFRNNIYSDKILAPIREYICNAYDSAVFAKSEQFVEVKITKDYIWAVRDYGRGLSQEDVETVFGILGETTKENDYSQVGQFGIGGSSAFAYTDTFYIDSYHEGVHKSYVATLGGNTEGVSIGTMYKVFEEPTEETGIEVSFEIKSKDLYDFRRKTTTFVEQFLPDVKLRFTDEQGDIITPKQPLKSVDMKVYSIHAHESIYNPSVSIRMGGVVYDDDSITLPRNSRYNFRIDVPIGKLSIPISRESLEDTQSNKNVLKEIEQILIDLKQADVDTCPIPKFGETQLKGNSHSFKGEFFEIDYGDAYPEMRRLRRLITFERQYSNTGGNIVYVLPNIKSVSSWLKRLEIFMDSAFPNTRYYWVKNTDNFKKLIEAPNFDIGDTLFADIKTLKLPKLPKNNQTAFLVYRNKYKRTSSAEDLEEYVAHDFFKDEEVEEDWYLKVKDFSGLNQRTIAYVKDYGQSNNFWTTASKKMKEELLEIGWIDVDSDEYRNRADEIRAELKARQNMENAGYNYKFHMFGLEPAKRITTAIGKNPAKLDKLKLVKANLSKENSFRGRLIRSLQAGGKYYTRQDLRQLLKIKH